MTIEEAIEMLSEGRTPAAKRAINLLDMCHRVRDHALEDAAKIADVSTDPHWIAERIRDLKRRP